MALVPDRGRPIFPLQENVDIHQGGTKPKATYDLALYEELGSNGTKAVLEVTTIIVFNFTDGWRPQPFRSMNTPVPTPNEPFRSPHQRQH